MANEKAVFKSEESRGRKGIIQEQEQRKNKRRKAMGIQHSRMSKILKNG
jgi:hypothetical protein